MVDDNDRAERIQRVLEACMKTLAEAGEVRFDEVMAAHQDLMPELGEELDQLAALEKGVRGLDLEDPLAVQPPSQDRGSEIAAIEPPGGAADESESSAAAKAVKHYPKIDGYRIVGVLGQGGMGIVYKAIQIKLDRAIALKVLPAVVGTANPASVARFRREAQAAARLHHSNIVPVYDFGESHDSYYFSMEIVQGFTIERLIALLAQSDGSHPSGIKLSQLFSPTEESGSEEPSRSGGMRIVDERLTSSSGHSGRDYFNQVAVWMANAANALQYAHSEGIIHRDIKPSNLLLTEDRRIVIADFGLAKLVDESSDTMTGSLLGTIRYMSPEQAMAKRMPLDHRTDIYSLGATMYELLTMQPAFDAEDDRTVLGKIVTQDPIAPRKINSSVPRDLETICLTAMEKSPGARFSTARAMEEDLHRYIKDLPIVVRRPSYPVRGLKFIRRHRAISLAVVLTVAIMVSIVLFSFWRQSQRQIWRNKGLESIKARQWLEAERNFNMILDQDANDADALASLCTMRVWEYNTQTDKSSSQLLEKAENECKRALDISPKHVVALNTLGVVYKKRRKYDEALAAYQKILDDEPDSYRALVNKGTVLALQRKLDESYASILSSTLNTDHLKKECPYSVDTWRTLASFQLYRGDRANGFKSLAKALECKKDDVGALLLKARYLMGEDLDESYDALVLAKHFLGEKPDAKYYRLYAQYHLRRGDFRKAARASERALETGGLAVINRLITAIAWANLNEGDFARRQLEQATANCPPELMKPDGYLPTADGPVLWFETANEVERLLLQAETALGRKKDAAPNNPN